MGKNSKPLRIGVIGIPLSYPAIQALMAKGHDIYEVISAIDSKTDVIIGPQCWRIDPRIKLGDDTEEESLERQLEMMEKGVRAIKFPKEKKHAG